MDVTTSFSSGRKRAGFWSKFTTMRTSAAIAPSSPANTGFRSISAISGKSLTSCDTRTMVSCSASRLTGSPPRTPLSISAAWMPSSIEAASSCVAGARRKVTSLSTSTSTPPMPKATSLPKLSSVIAPTIDFLAALDHLLDLHADDLGVGLVLLRVGDDLLVGGGGFVRALHAHDHAAGFGLVQDVGRDDLHHDRETHGDGELRCFGGARDHAFLGHVDAVGVANELALRRRERVAAFLLHRVEDLRGPLPCRLGVGHVVPLEN